jgi:hypothetical protein
MRKSECGRRKNSKKGIECGSRNVEGGKIAKRELNAEGGMWPPARRGHRGLRPGGKAEHRTKGFECGNRPALASGSKSLRLGECDLIGLDYFRLN